MKKLIHPYCQKFAEIFRREKDKISKHIKKVEIHHIGSTSVPGLGGKGIIDTMIGIKSWKEADDVVKQLRMMDFKHIHPKEKGRIFLSKVGQTRLGGSHIHIVIRDSKPYKEILAFRNYLRKNKKEAERFFKLKQEWAKEVKGVRIKYGELKGKYVRGILRVIHR